MSKKLLEVTHGAPDRPLTINGIEIPCYVLNNKQRVISQSGFLKAIGLQYRGAGKGSPARLAQFVTGQRLSPFISKELRDLTVHPIKFKSPTGEAYGYEATILVDVCDSIIEANKHGVLIKQQKHLVENAEMLIRAFAKTGIIALIDEVTGYQEVREKDSLKQFLEKFLQEEKGKWIKTYPDEFFEMIFKMKGWTWHYASVKKPSVVGHYINDFVYARIGPQVLKELKERIVNAQTGKKSGTMHQYLTPDYGHPRLREHIAALVALGKASGHNWNNFKRMIERAFPKFGETLNLDLPEADEE